MPYYIGSYLVKVRLTTHSKLNSTGVRTRDLQIMDSTFHIPEILVQTTEPSGASTQTRLRIVGAF